MLAMASTQRQAAQNQHYVPKFILRNFLSNEAKERVSVFSKKTGKGFVTSIGNIMAERRFHEFAIDEDYMASFEESICRIEDMLLPTYNKVVEERRLDLEPEERATLAMFMAFQFVRTRQQREQFQKMEDQLGDHLAKWGGSIDQMENYEPLTPDTLTHQHIQFMKSSVPKFAKCIAIKDLLLLSAPEGRSFYLADNPVCLHNREPAHPLFGNIGLNVEGIEIYLPLTADLMLAAWCPTLIGKVRAEHLRSQDEWKGRLVSMLARGQITVDQMRQQMDTMKTLLRPVNSLLTSFDDGAPVPVNEANMDFHNSLQLNYAREFIICKQGDFKLASRFVDEDPTQSGMSLAMS